MRTSIFLSRYRNKNKEYFNKKKEEKVLILKKEKEEEEKTQEKINSINSKQNSKMNNTSSKFGISPIIPDRKIVPAKTKNKSIYFIKNKIVWCLILK